MSGVNLQESAALRRAIDFSYEMEEAARVALSPEHHQPHWDGLGEPHSWICTVCQGDGWQTSWPCEVAQTHGREVAEAGGLRFTW
jgi:hypothetical protein